MVCIHKPLAATADQRLAKRLLFLNSGSSCVILVGSRSSGSDAFVRAGLRPLWNARNVDLSPKDVLSIGGEQVLL